MHKLQIRARPRLVSNHFFPDQGCGDYALCQSRHLNALTSIKGTGSDTCDQWRNMKTPALIETLRAYFHSCDNYPEMLGGSHQPLSW